MPQLYKFRRFAHDTEVEYAVWDTATIAGNQITARKGNEVWNIWAVSLEPLGDPDNEIAKIRQEEAIEEDEAYRANENELLTEIHLSEYMVRRR